MSEHNDPKVEIESLSDDDLESASGGAGLQEIVNSGTGTCIENTGTGTCGS
jgi:hypothetical protein